MTPATARADDAPLDWKAPVPPAPATLEETGLGYEALKQLLTKSLFADPTQFLRAGALVKKVRDLKLTSSRPDRSSYRPPQGIRAKWPLQQSDVV